MKGGLKRKKKMKKLNLLVFLVMTMLFGVVGVMADDVDQGINVTIGTTIQVIILPTTINFGSVLPNTNNNPATENVSFNAAGSNINVSVAVTSVTGEPFISGLKFDNVLVQGHAPYVLPCVLSGELCTYVLKTVGTTLNIPATFQKGTKTGTITYTITEAL